MKYILLVLFLVFVSVQSKSQTLKLISPNGGEKFEIGKDSIINIKWEGNPNDTFQIEYAERLSLDWDTIATNINGLSYKWKNFPKNISKDFQIKVIKLSKSGKQTAKLDSIVIYGWQSSVVTSVAISKDASKIITGMYDNSVRVWNAKDGTLIYSFIGHKDHITSVALSKDNTKLVSASSDKEIKIWDFNSGTLIRTLVGHTNTVNSVAINESGTRIISCSEDNTIKIWNALNGDLIKSISGHSFYPVNSVVISSNDDFFISGSNDKTIKIWDFNSGALRKTLIGHTNSILSLAISSNNKSIASGSSDYSAKIWDVVSGNEVFTFKQDYRATSVAFTKDNSKLIAGYDDHSAKIYDLKTGLYLSSLIGHDEGISSIAISEDSTKVLLGANDKLASMWDLSTGNKIRTFCQAIGTIKSISMNPNSNSFCTINSNRVIKVWDIKTKNYIQNFDINGNQVECAKYSKSGDKLYTADGYGIKIWDTKTGTLIKTFSTYMPNTSEIIVNEEMNYLIALSSQNIRMIDLNDGTFIRTISTKSFFESIATNKDVNIIYTIYNDTLSIWDLYSGSLTKNIGFTKNHNNSDFILSNDEKSFYIPFYNSVGQYDLMTAQNIKGFSAQGSIIQSKLSEDNKIIMLSKNNSNYFLDIVINNNALNRFYWQLPQNAQINCLANNKDASFLLTGNEDNTISCLNLSYKDILIGTEFDTSDSLFSIVNSNSTVKDINYSNIDIHPNPAQNFISLNLINTEFNNSQNINFKLLNTLGEIVIEKDLTNISNPKVQIDLENISSGLYYGLLSNNKFTKNFIVSIVK